MRLDYALHTHEAHSDYSPLPKSGSLTDLMREPGSALTHLVGLIAAAAATPGLLRHAAAGGADQLALTGQRPGGVNNPFSFSAHRGNKTLLRWNVGIEGDPLQTGIAAAPELSLRRRRKGRGVGLQHTPRLGKRGRCLIEPDHPSNTLKPMTFAIFLICFIQSPKIST